MDDAGRFLLGLFIVVGVVLTVGIVADSMGERLPGRQCAAACGRDQVVRVCEIQGGSVSRVECAKP